MGDNFFVIFFRGDHIFVCDAYYDTNHDTYLWSSTIEFKDISHPEVMSEM